MLPLHHTPVISATGLEPAVYGLEVRCSHPLSYADMSASRRIRTFDLPRIRRKLCQLSYACIRSYSDSNAEYGVRSPAVSPLAYKSKAPYTRFERASPFGPTVFKTAPSPPGHTAYKGEEDRTLTYGIKTRCAAITLRPFMKYDSGWIRTTGTFYTSNSLAGSRNRPTLPRCQGKPSKRMR